MAKTRNSDRGVSKWRLCTRTYVKHMVRGICGRIGWEWRHFFSAMCPEHQFLHGLPTAQKSRPQFSWGCLKEKKRFYCEDMMRRSGAKIWCEGMMRSWEEARTLSESFRELKMAASNIKLAMNSLLKLLLLLSLLLLLLLLLGNRQLNKGTDK